jgi:hypothetical protein
MQFNQAQFAAVIAAAKAANSPRWIRAIERAALALQSGELVVSLLHNGALVTSPRGSYCVNSHCECEASRRGHAERYHRAAVRLVEMLETAPAAPARSPRVVRSIERNYNGPRLHTIRVNGWLF